MAPTAAVGRLSPAGRVLSPCGTWAAYKRHLKRGERPCSACAEASRRNSAIRNKEGRNPRGRLGPRWSETAAPRLCALCRSQYHPNVINPKFCSALCAYRAKHPGTRVRSVIPKASRKSGGRPWRRLRAEVLASSTHCAICGLGIDKALRFPHPMSFTVDHIVPVSLGGTIVDPDNVRAAHLRCNVKRGQGVRAS